MDRSARIRRGVLLVDGLVALWLYLEAPVSPSPNGMVDYKFYCFHSEPKFLYVSQGVV